jgi:hypothetical protein
MQRLAKRFGRPLVAAGLLVVGLALPASAQPVLQQDSDAPSIAVVEEGPAIQPGVAETVPGPTVPGSDRPSGIGIDPAADPAQSALVSCQMWAETAQDCL